MNVWAEGSTRQPTCLICKAPVKLHGICNGCVETGRRLDEPCGDCEVTPVCICEIGSDRARVLVDLEEKR